MLTLIFENSKTTYRNEGIVEHCLYKDISKCWPALRTQMLLSMDLTYRANAWLLS